MITFPLSRSPEFSEEDRKVTQDQMERVILRLLAECPELHYYQGLHDVVLTLLLVTGEDIAYAIMSVLVRCHIRYSIITGVTKSFTYREWKMHLA